MDQQLPARWIVLQRCNLLLSRGVHLMVESILCWSVVLQSRPFVLLAIFLGNPTMKVLYLAKGESHGLMPLAELVSHLLR